MLFAGLIADRYFAEPDSDFRGGLIGLSAFLFQGVFPEAYQEAFSEAFSEVFSEVWPNLFPRYFPLISRRGAFPAIHFSV